MKENQIYQTTDYSKFKLLKGNRPLTLNSIELLKKSIDLHGLIQPIQVNHNLEILDGQHRYVACKETNTPLKYYVTNGEISTVIETNTIVRQWSNEDALKSGVSLGNENYIKLNELKNEFPKIPLSNLIKILGGSWAKSSKILSSGSRVQVNRFKKGLFKAGDIEIARLKANKLMDFAPYYNRFYQKSFVSAVLQIIDLPQYNHRRMISRLKLERCPKIEPQRNAKDYIELLESIYNYHLSNKVTLRF